MLMDWMQKTLLFDLIQTFRLRYFIVSILNSQDGTKEYFPGDCNTLTGDKGNKA